MVKPQTAGICLLMSFACDRYIDHVSCDSPQHVAEAKTCSLHRFTLGTPFWLHRLVLAWSKIASLLAVTKAPPPRPKRKLTKIQQLAASVWETLGKALGIFQVQRNGPRRKLGFWALQRLFTLHVHGLSQQLFPGCERIPFIFVYLVMRGVQRLALIIR